MGESNADGGIYKFGFWITLICWVLAVPLSLVSIYVAQKILSLWAWSNSADGQDFLSIEYWIFGVKSEEPFFLWQMWFDSIVSFASDFGCYAVGLLFTFWCFISLRRKMDWHISVSSVVMFVCVLYLIFGLLGLLTNAYYSWKVYELGTLGCDVLSRDFYKCNYVLLEFPRVAASLAHITAAVFAGQIYSRRLDDTDAWVEELSKRAEERLSLYGLLK